MNCMRLLDQDANAQHSADAAQEHQGSTSAEAAEAAEAAAKYHLNRKKMADMAKQIKSCIKRL